MMGHIAMLVLVSGTLLAQDDAEKGARAAQALLDEGKHCEAAAEYEKLVASKDPATSASASFQLAESLDQIADGTCLGITDVQATRKKHYLRAIDIATAELKAPDAKLKALSTNAYALFLYEAAKRLGFSGPIGEEYRQQAITRLKDLTKDLTKEPQQGADPQPRTDPLDLAAYQFNLGVIYKSAPPDYVRSVESFEQALGYNPNLELAASNAFELLGRTPKNTEKGHSQVMQAAEIASLLIANGRARVAADGIIGMLKRTGSLKSGFSGVDSEILLGVLLRCYLALPFDGEMFADDWKGLGQTCGDKQLKSARCELQLAYKEAPRLYGKRDEVYKAYRAWIEGPSSTSDLAALLRRRGALAEAEKDASGALKLYSTAWYLDPASTEAAAESACLLASGVKPGSGLQKDLRAAYVRPTTFLGKAIEWILDDPVKSEAESDTDRRNVALIEAALVNTECDRSGAWGQTSTQLKPRRPVEGDRQLTLAATQLSRDAGIGRAVYLEIFGKSLIQKVASQGEKLQEVAVAPVDSDGVYTLGLFRPLKAGQTIKVHDIIRGTKLPTECAQYSKDSASCIRVASGELHGLRHVHAFASVGLDSASSKISDPGTPSFSIMAEGSFRFNNHGLQYLPRRNGLLLSAFASFSVAPFSVSRTSSPLIQVNNARTFEVGVYTPLLFNRLSWYYRGAPFALFAAPIAKVGVHAAGAEGARTFYKYAAGGLRIGVLRFGRYGERVPTLEHYLDVTAGRWGNLERYSGPVPEIPSHLELHWHVTICQLLYGGYLKTTGRGPNDSRVFLGVRFDVTHPLARLSSVLRQKPQ